MICVNLHAVLLITPDGSIGQQPSKHTQDSWMKAEANTAGEALRHVRHYKPSILVLDLSGQRAEGADFDRMLDVIAQVRTRIPGTPIVVLGAADEPAMERAVRRQGVTVYLPISQEHGHRDVRGVVQALYARHGPARVHGPPASGVPPR